MQLHDEKARLVTLKEAIFCDGELEMIEELFAPGFRHNDPSFPQVRSRDDYRRWVMALRAAIPDFRLFIEEIFGEGERIAVRFTARGTHSGMLLTPLGPAAPTGKAVAIDGFTIYQLRQGKVVEDWFLADFLGLLQQLQLVPSALALA